MIGIDETKVSTELSKRSGKHLKSIGSDVDDGSEFIGKLPNFSEADYNLPTQLIQRYVKVSCGSRLVILLSILRNLNEREAASQKVVVFFSTRVDFYPKLELHQKKAFRLHGNVEHEGRRTAFQGLKQRNQLYCCAQMLLRGA
ncbi:hypothetical protein IFM89_028570 [Coptis chinensis]|uniref:Uncharacterized protein n=1 Tax=Coptis chinensis TaxID=261450 RepID=A0A835M704_9MAGN|nr:hypothetical protein IFM89_028570 [Coptis chinensis]